MDPVVGCQDQGPTVIPSMIELNSIALQAVQTRPLLSPVDLAYFFGYN